MRCQYRVSEFVAERFRWVSWDGEVVLYDKLTGGTHRLAFPTGIVLELVSAECQKSVGDLVSELNAVNSLSPISEDQLLPCLDTLCDLGLLTSIPCEAFQPLPR